MREPMKFKDMPIGCRFYEEYFDYGYRAVFIKTQTMSIGIIKNIWVNTIMIEGEAAGNGFFFDCDKNFYLEAEI